MRRVLCFLCVLTATSMSVPSFAQLEGTGGKATGESSLPPTTADIPGGLVPFGLLPNLRPSAEQAAPTIGAASLAGPVDPATYRVGPGDQLQLQLWGRLSRTSLMQVNPEGFVLFPGAGSVDVKGLTLAQVRSELLRRIQSQYRGVNMDLRLARPRGFRVYLTGQVKAPGPLDVVATYRVGDLLIEGSLKEDASRRRIEVRHMDGTVDYADLAMFLSTGRQDFNPYLRDGDVINVGVATEFVWAQGALGRSGKFELGLKDSLITLFKLAGDPIPAADVDRALLVRWKDPVTPDSLWLRLDDVYERRTNPVLRDGDHLYVYYMPQYHQQQEVAIVGEVTRPGLYPIVEGKQRISDLVTAAGGFLATADLSSIRVVRQNPASKDKDPELDRLLRLSRDQLTISEYDKLTTKLAALRDNYSIDWKRLQASRKELDLLLRDGDIVRVDRLLSSIRIDGEVRRPGILSFQSGQEVGVYVKQAGGFTDRAWKSRVRVTRAVTGQTLPARNVRVLDPGDFVWVPERPDVTPWDHTRTILTALAQIATVVIAIRSVR